MGREPFTQLKKVKFKAIYLIDSHLSTDCLQPLKVLRGVASLVIYDRCFHAHCSSELANCMPRLLRCPAAHDFLLKLVLLRCIFLLQEITPKFTSSSFSLVNSERAGSPGFLLSYNLNSFKIGALRHLRNRYG